MPPKRFPIPWITLLLLIADKSEGYAPDYPAGTQFYNSEVSSHVVRSKYNREASDNNAEHGNEAPSNAERGIGYWSEDFEGKILGQRSRGEEQRVITMTKTIPYPVERSVHYPVVKKIFYPVKIPFPQRYAVQKEIPYPVKVYVKVPMKIPKPVPVVKEIPYPVKVPVERPVPHNIYIPLPYPVEKIVHYEVEVPVADPYPIEKKIPVPVRVFEHVAQPCPIEEEEELYPVKIEAEKPIPVHDPESDEPTIEKQDSSSFEEETPTPIVEYPKNREPWLREEENYGATEDFHSNDENIDR